MAIDRQTRKISVQRKAEGLGGFRGLASVLERFHDLGNTAIYPGRAILFSAGDAPNGIYVVCSGHVKLFATSQGNRTMILRIARKDDVLGLSATLNNLPYEVTAETLESCTFRHVGQNIFLNLVETYVEVGHTTAMTLAKDHYEIYRSMRRLALSASAMARIAQVLIELANLHVGENVHLSVPAVLTHAEIASLAGTSRETVTRALNQFERDEIISRSSSKITILRLPQLEQLAC